MDPLKGEQIPKSVSVWKHTAVKKGVLGTVNELGSQEKVYSASKFLFKHFIGLRVIYKYSEEKDKRSSLPTDIVKQFRLPASMALEKIPGWATYLTEISKFEKGKVNVAGSCISRSLGPWVNVWQYHKHVILGDENEEYADMSKISMVAPVLQRTRLQQEQHTFTYASPTPAPKPDPTQQLTKKMQQYTLNAAKKMEGQVDSDSDEDQSDDDLEEFSYVETPVDPRDAHDADFYTPGRNARGQLIKDEQTVNVFLLAFLSAITATTVPFHTRWLAERNAMVFQKKVRYVARTDGHLRGKNGESHSLIEVKPRRRTGDVMIRVQESAQMAAWITQNKEESHDPHKQCRIFLLSQDKDEIFITFPRWSKAYGKDNQNIQQLTEDDFLWMEECGPFRLREKDEIAQIANFLHGYTVHKSGILPLSGR